MRLVLSGACGEPSEPAASRRLAIIGSPLVYKKFPFLITRRESAPNQVKGTVVKVDTSPR